MAGRELSFGHWTVAITWQPHCSPKWQNLRVLSTYPIPGSSPALPLPAHSREQGVKQALTLPRQIQGSPQPPPSPSLQAASGTPAEVSGIRYSQNILPYKCKRGLLSPGARRMASFSCPHPPPKSAKPTNLTFGIKTPLPPYNYFQRQRKSYTIKFPTEPSSRQSCLLTGLAQHPVSSLYPTGQGPLSLSGEASESLLTIIFKKRSTGDRFTRGT